MRGPLMLCALLTLTVISVGADEQLRIAVTPAQSFAPSTVRIRARVVPNAENRSLQIVAESSDFYRSSQISLEGDHAPASNMFEFRGLSGGEYVVAGILIDRRGHQRAIAEQEVRVISPLGK